MKKEILPIMLFALAFSLMTSPVLSEDVGGTIIVEGSGVTIEIVEPVDGKDYNTKNIPFDIDTSGDNYTCDVLDDGTAIATLDENNPSYTDTRTKEDGEHSVTVSCDDGTEASVNYTVSLALLSSLGIWSVAFLMIPLLMVWAGFRHYISAKLEDTTESMIVYAILALLGVVFVIFLVTPA